MFLENAVFLCDCEFLLQQCDLWRARLMKYFLTILMSVAVVSQAFAVGSSGFSTQMVGAKALGQGHAFVAEADDPSAVYFNPAGMTQLKGVQMSVGLNALVPMTDRTGGGMPDDS